MKKKLLAVAASTAMITSMLVGSALAENRVEVKVTSEPIQSRSTCDKVGGFSLEFDRGTTLLDGDRITIDTDYVSPANLTALCRGIDFLIAPDATGSPIAGNSGNAWDEANTPPVGTGEPVAYEVNAPVAAPAGIGVNFHVFGSVGGQRITVDVVGEDVGSSLAVADLTADDKLIVKFLDQQTTNIFENTVADPLSIFEDAGELADNTLCLNVSQWDGPTVNGNMDSKDDKFTFIPSNPQVAHIVAANSYTVEACKGGNCGNIPIGAEGQQGAGATCNDFVDGTEEGYCKEGSDLHNANDLLIQRTNGAWDGDDYELTLEVLVNGEIGDNGVFFAGAPTAEGFETEELACAGATAAVGLATNYLADGSVATGLGTADCDVAAGNRVVKIVTTGADLGLNGTTDDYLKIDLPAMVYDVDDIAASDQVSVRVTVTRAPCGEIITTDHCVGSLVNSCPITPGDTSTTVSFPYFTEGNTDGFFDGIALTNLSTADGVVNLTMYEADGDVATATVPLTGKSIYANTLESMIANGDFTLTTSVDGTLGNARSQIIATSPTLLIDGFGMMGNNATGVSMGYLPRK